MLKDAEGMLKHILATGPGNGTPVGPRAMASADSTDSTKIDEKREFSRGDRGDRGDRADGLGPRTDARGEARGDVTPGEMPPKPAPLHYYRTEHRYQNMRPLAIGQRLPQPQPPPPPPNVKHSPGGASSGSPKFANGGLNISRVTAAGAGPVNLVPANVARFMTRSKEVGIKEMLTSLGLLCLVSLLLALLSLIFLLKISPVTSSDVRELLRAEQLSVISAEEYVVVYEVTLALCALALSLNLCCLLVCAVQFLFAVKLVNSNGAAGR